MITIVYTFTQSGSNSGLFNRLYVTQEMKRQVFKKYTELTKYTALTKYWEEHWTIANVIVGKIIQF